MFSHDSKCSITVGRLTLKYDMDVALPYWCIVVGLACLDRISKCDNTVGHT